MSEGGKEAVRYKSRSARFQRVPEKRPWRGEILREASEDRPR